MALLPLALAVMYFQRVLLRRVASGIAQELTSPHPRTVRGRTEQRHAELDFRVGADGQDYCTEHSLAATLRARL